MVTTIVLCHIYFIAFLKRVAGGNGESPPRASPHTGALSATVGIVLKMIVRPMVERQCTVHPRPSGVRQRGWWTRFRTKVGRPSVVCYTSFLKWA